MWDNFGLKKKNENLAAYQMAAEVMDRVGIHEGTVFRYHQARRNTRNYQVDLETLEIQQINPGILIFHSVKFFYVI